VANQDPKKAAEFLSIQENIEKAAERQLQILQQVDGASAKRVAQLEAEYNAIERTVSSLNKAEGFQKGFATATADANKYQAMIAANSKNIFKATGKVEDISKSILQTEALLVKVQESGNKELADGIKARLNQLKSDKNALKVQAQSAKGFGLINDAIQDNIGAVSEFVGKLPGGGVINKAFGLDTLGAGFEKALSKAAMVNAEVGGGMKGATAGAQAFSKSLFAALGPIGLIAAAVAGLAMVFTKVSHQAHEISESTGLAYSQSKAMVKEANKLVASGAAQLANTEDILKVQSALVSEMGIQNAMSTETAAEVADIGKSFGYGATQAAAVNAQFQKMGMSAEAAADMQRDLAAESMKAGVSVGAVMKDISENAADVAVYFGGNTKELKKAAIQAAKLGVSLKTMKGVADGLLNFEESITAQAELQALTGRQINLDMARQLALEGDIAGATKEVLSQVGDIHDFNNMDYLARKKLAEATGMSVDELQKSLTIQDKLAGATDEQRAAAMGLGLSAAELADMSAEDLQNKIASKQANEKLAASFATIKATLVNALLPAAEALMGVFQFLSPIIKGIAIAIGAILAPVKLLGSIFSGTTDDLSAMDVILGAIGVTMGIIYGLANAQNIATKVQVGYEKMKSIFGSKEVIQKGLIRAASAAGLVTENQKVLALGRQTMIGKGNLAQANTMNLYKNQGLATQIKTNVQAGYAMVKEKATNAFLAVRNALKSGELGTTIAINAQKALGFAKDVASNALAMGRQVIEKGILAVQLAINVAKTVANVIAAGAVVPLMASAGAAIAAAIPSIFTGFGMIPFGLGIPLAFAAVAGLIGLIASMSTGDDVVSKATGGGGYGSRVLFGPEGAISFNNKDTIVAGTNLFGQANDAMFAPKGALKMNDGAVGDMPDPPEAKIVGITGESVAKLSIGIAAAMGTAFGPAIIAAFTMAVPVLVAGMTMAVTMGTVAALTMTMPLIGATIAGGIVAGALATAMIPKPVLVMNPVMPTFELNPMTYSIMGAIGGAMGAIGGLFGGKKEEKEKPVTMADVIDAISNIEITLDGKKVGKGVRVAESFGRGA
jgi:hypothetical protein